MSSRAVCRSFPTALQLIMTDYRMDHRISSFSCSSQILLLPLPENGIDEGVYMFEERRLGAGYPLTRKILATKVNANLVTEKFAKTE